MRRLGLLPLALCLSSCAAPPMTLTKALFRERPAVPDIVEGHYACDVEAVRGRLDQAPSARAMAVDVTFPEYSEQRLPAHLQAYGSTDSASDTVKATFALTPVEGRKRWPEDYARDGATRLGLGLRFQDARYFGDGTAAAEVTFAGTVSRADVARVVRSSHPGAAASAWQDLAIPQGLAPMLRLVRRHSFGHLLGVTSPGARDRCDLVAWLGSNDEVLAHEDVLLLLQPWRAVELERIPPTDIAFDECALLLRLVHQDGGVHYVRVPLPLLREGDDLALVPREQDQDVGWSRRDVWRAKMQPDAGPTEAWPEAGLRLAATRVPYGFDELDHPSKVPGAILRTVLAPVAFVVDVLGATNPMIQALINWFAPDPPRPFKPAGGNR